MWRTGDSATADRAAAAQVSRSGASPARRARLALIFGLVVVVAAIVATLLGSPMAVISANGMNLGEKLAKANHASGACQDGETLPAGTSAIRVTLFSLTGPRVRVTALAGSRLLTGGSTGSGWTGGTATVAVSPPPARTRQGVRVCFGLSPSVVGVTVEGKQTAPASAARDFAGETLPGRFGVEYLRDSSGTWWSWIGTVGQRIGLGRAPGGGGVAILALVLVALAVAAGSRLALQELR